MFCPECETEYIDGITVCADCHTPLVETLADDDIPDDESAATEDLIPIMTFLDREEAIIARGFLESNGVEAILSTDETMLIRQGITSSSGIQLLIRPEDKQDAEEIFKMAGIYPEDRPYLYEKELPEMDIDADNKWKETASKVLLFVLLAAVIILIVKHFLD